MGVVRHFKRFWRFHSFIALSLSVSAFTLGCAVKEPAFFEGTWVVTEAHQPGISAVSPQQAQTNSTHACQTQCRVGMSRIREV